MEFYATANLQILIKQVIIFMYLIIFGDEWKIRFSDPVTDVNIARKA
jgi:hypothetical protein